MMLDQETWFKAVSDGDEKTLSEALAAGFDVNTRDEKLNTALHHATKAGHHHIMRLLISAGSELNIQNDYDSTALHLTAKNMDSIRILLEAGADPNLKDKDYDYPYYFAFYGSMPRELTELYIKHGANLMLFDK
ncbi:MAG: ankyrin repeat domain-containing protein [Mariprofundus sp.]|nr:ankyrin repeat domain-containing protein [Mariprofundus sp.]